MAAQVLQSVDPAHPSVNPDPQPGPSRTATVADESDEIAAESGVVSTNGQSNGAGGAGEAANGTGGEEEGEEDPDAIPKNACETLYIQNLNEKVQLPGELGVCS